LSFRLKSGGPGDTLDTSGIRGTTVTPATAPPFVAFRQEACMTQAAHHGPLSFLNTDGRSHPVENAFALVTLLLGAIAALTAISPGLHVVSSWVGLVGIATGGWGQMISATTAERFVLVIGLGAAAVGFYLGVAHGGLYG
jgi:hypothetical protein